VKKVKNPGSISRYRFSLTRALTFSALMIVGLNCRVGLAAGGNSRWTANSVVTAEECDRYLRQDVGSALLRRLVGERLADNQPVAFDQPRSEALVKILKLGVKDFEIAEFRRIRYLGIPSPHLVVYRINHLNRLTSIILHGVELPGEDKFLEVNRDIAKFRKEAVTRLMFIRALSSEQFVYDFFSRTSDGLSKLESGEISAGQVFNFIFTVLMHHSAVVRRGDPGLGF
jgi:hypothetical protein